MHFRKALKKNFNYLTSNAR